MFFPMVVVFNLLKSIKMPFRLMQENLRNPESSEQRLRHLTPAWATDSEWGRPAPLPTPGADLGLQRLREEEAAGPDPNSGTPGPIAQLSVVSLLLQQLQSGERERESMSERVCVT